MDKMRAIEIFNSADTVRVELEGKDVWIEEIDEGNGMATVQIGSNPLNTQTVSVDRLQEAPK